MQRAPSFWERIQSLWERIQSFTTQFFSQHETDASTQVMLRSPSPNLQNLGCQTTFFPSRVHQPVLPLSYTPEELQQIWQITLDLPPSQIYRGVVNGKKYTVMQSGEGPFLLFTHSKEQAHPLIGMGAFKKAKFALSLQSGMFYVVLTEKGDSSREMKLHAELQTNTIVKLVGFICDKSHISRGIKSYFVEEYCEQGSLGSLMKSRDLSAHLVLQWSIELIQGVQDIHRAQIAHLDLHINNIYIHEDHIKIGDFGHSQKKPINLLHQFTRDRHALKEILQQLSKCIDPQDPERQMAIDAISGSVQNLWTMDTVGSDSELLAQAEANLRARKGINVSFGLRQSPEGARS